MCNILLWNMCNILLWNMCNILPWNIFNICCGICGICCCGICAKCCGALCAICCCGICAIFYRGICSIFAVEYVQYAAVQNVRNVVVHYRQKFTIFCCAILSDMCKRNNYGSVEIWSINISTICAMLSKIWLDMVDMMCITRWRNKVFSELHQLNVGWDLVGLGGACILSQPSQLTENECSVSLWDFPQCFGHSCLWCLLLSSNILDVWFSCVCVSVCVRSGKLEFKRCQNCRFICFMCFASHVFARIWWNVDLLNRGC